MLLLNRILTFLAPVLTFVSFEILFVKPTWIWFLFAAIQVILFFIIWQITGRKFRSFQFWNFLITPHLFLATACFFSISLESRFFLHTVAVLSSVVLGIFLEEIFVYFNLPKKYYPYSLENISNYINLLTVFLLFSSLYSLIVFLNFSMWYLSLIVIAFIFLLAYQSTWVNKISFRKAWLFILVITLILTELFSVISFLPTSFYVNAIVLTVCYYIILGLSRFILLEELEKKPLRRYLIIGFIAIVIALLTAQWN